MTHVFLGLGHLSLVLILKLHAYWLAFCRVRRFSHALTGEKSPTVLPSHEP